MKSDNTYKVLIVFLLLMVILYSWANHQWTSIVASDGKGYYAYLPAIVNYHDLTWSFYKEGIEGLPAEYTDSFLFQMGEGLVDKYPAGMAILVLPFYVVGHLIAWIFNFPLTGYSKPYFAAINAAAVFYLLTGLRALQLIFQRKGYRQSVFFISAIAIVSGTNLLNYIVNEPSLSHVYSFGMISLFSWYVLRWTNNERQADIVRIAATAALIILIRPINILAVVSIPLIIGGYKKLLIPFKQLLTDNKRFLLYAIAVFIVIVAVQPILWYLQNGKWWNETYAGEGFNWMEPATYKALFGYRKGWVLYTPFVILLFISWCYHLLKRDWNMFFASFSFWAVIIYVTTSWYNWYYGGSFGQRPFTDFYGTLLIATAPFIDYAIRSRGRILLYLFTGGCIILNQVQFYQYDSNILHYDSMNKESYRKVFLRTGNEYKWIAFLNDRQYVPGFIRESVYDSLFNDFEWTPPRWSEGRYDHDGDALSGTRSVFLTPDHPSTPMAEFSLPDSMKRKDHFFMRGWLKSPDGLADCRLVLKYEDSERNEVLREEKTLDLFLTGSVREGWQEFVWYDQFPACNNCKAEWLKLFVVNKGSTPVHADDFVVAVYK